MSGRCRACDKKLEEYEMARKIKSPLTGAVQYTDLCSLCINAGDFNDLSFIDDDSNLLEVDDE